MVPILLKAGEQTFSFPLNTQILATTAFITTSSTYRALSVPGTAAQTWCYLLCLPFCIASLETGPLRAAAVTWQPVRACTGTPAGSQAKFVGQIQLVGLAWWKPGRGQDPLLEADSSVCETENGLPLWGPPLHGAFLGSPASQRQ